MSSLPVAMVGVDLTLAASPQGLTLAVKELADEYAADYEFWSSVRRVNGKQYFRLGLRELLETPAGRISFRGYELSGDILFVPNEGKDDEWFSTGKRYDRICVRSRACSASLNEPLCDLSVAEATLAQTVATIAATFKATTEQITKGNMAPA